MKKICILGLGNPGSKYLTTWHNLGFLFVDFLAHKYGVKFSLKTNLKSEIAEFVLGDFKILLVKPQTFMNLSGDAFVSVKNYYDLETSNMMVVFDDFDLPMLKTRLRKEGSAGTHNGMRSIISVSKSQDFPRFKIGFKPDHQVSDLSGYVLSNIPSKFTDDLRELFEASETEILKYFKENSAK